MSHAERILISGPKIIAKCKGCLLSVAALLLGGLLALGVFTITVGHFLTVVDAFSQADAIVVLGGDVDRVQHAVDLFNEDYAPVVVFSGGTIEQGSMGAGEQRGGGAEVNLLCTLAPLHLCTGGEQG